MMLGVMQLKEDQEGAANLFIIFTDICTKKEATLIK